MICPKRGQNMTLQKPIQFMFNVMAIYMKKITIQFTGFNFTVLPPTVKL